MTALTVSNPRTLIKHTLVIWTTRDDATGDIEDLARKAVSGGGYLSSHEQLTVQDPLSDPQPPSADFFGLHPDRTVYVVCSRPDPLTGGCGALEWRETEPEARLIYLQAVGQLKTDPDGGSVVLFRYNSALTGDDLTQELDDDELADDPALRIDSYTQAPRTDLPAGSGTSGPSH